MTKLDELTTEHYRKLAKIHGKDPRMSMRDLYIRESEIEFFRKSLKTLTEKTAQNLRVLDLGCGNGYVLGKLCQEFPKIEFSGLEYSKDLYQICLEQKAANLTFFHGDARDQGQFNHNQFDLIFSERAIINILDLKEQRKAFTNISQWLSSEGHYLCSESFREPLHELSKASQEMNFEELKPSKHNLFLWRRHFEKFLTELGLEKQPPALEENFLSTHFYMTRVVHRLIRPEGGRKNPKLFQKFFHEALPPAIGDFSPILFYHWQKKPI